MKKAKEKPTLEIKCVVCDKKRMVSRPWAKYCSDRCKSIGWALYQKAKMGKDEK